MSWWSIVFDYAGLKSTASNLIAEFGDTAVLTRANGDTFNPATGSYTGGTTLTITGKGARMMFSKSEINGETIQAADVRLMFQAGHGEPLIDDNCLFSGIDYRVMDVRIISPAGTDIYYDLQLRH
jgi:hypothetical protein